MHLSFALTTVNLWQVTGVLSASVSHLQRGQQIQSYKVVMRTRHSTLKEYYFLNLADEKIVEREGFPVR